MTNGHLPFDTVWKRIQAQEGNEFETTTGLPSTYEMSGDIFVSSRTEQNISRGDFERAFEHVPIESPGDIGNLVRGSAHIWSVLHDRRIRRGDW